MNVVVIEVKQKSTPLKKHRINLDDLFSEDTSEQRANPPQGINYDTGLSLNGVAIKLHLWKEKGDFYWHLKKTRQLEAVLISQTDADRLSINGIRCRAIRAAGTFHSRLMLPVYSNNVNKNELYLYCVSMTAMQSVKREVLDTDTMRQNIMSFSLRHHFGGYVKRLGLPSLKQKDKNSLCLNSASHVSSHFFSAHSYMVNGKHGTLSNDVSSRRLIKLKEIAYCFEGLLLLIASGYEHGDIKPDNIVRNDKGYVMIDFGLSQRALHSRSMHMDELAEHRLRNGTTIFMHPSLLIAPLMNGAKADLYGFCLSFIFHYCPLMAARYHHLSRCYDLATDKGFYEFKKGYRLVLARDANAIRQQALALIENDYNNAPNEKRVLKAMLEVCVCAWLGDSGLSQERSAATLIFNLSMSLRVPDEKLISAAVFNTGEERAIQCKALMGYKVSRLMLLLQEAIIQEDAVLGLTNSLHASFLSKPSLTKGMTIHQKLMYVAVMQPNHQLYFSFVWHADAIRFAQNINCLLSSVNDEERQTVAEHIIDKEGIKKSDFPIDLFLEHLNSPYAALFITKVKPSVSVLDNRI